MGYKLQTNLKLNIDLQNERAKTTINKSSFSYSETISEALILTARKRNVE